jgi:hypothetical protein
VSAVETTPKPAVIGAAHDGATAGAPPPPPPPPPPREAAAGVPPLEGASAFGEEIALASPETPSGFVTVRGYSSPGVAPADGASGGAARAAGGFAGLA